VQVPLIVNDRVDIAHAARADGVHLGHTDLTPASARAILGDDAIVGITVHHPHEAAADARVDYAGLGPVFATASKDPGDPPLDIEGLGRLAGATRARLGPLPLCAIAGIDETNARDVVASDVDGIAVIGALFRAPDIEAAARRLRRAVDDALSHRTKR
jgi:thiamine-phosphate pyrophosphorylase